ncbi:MAG: hypothetical protein IJC76_08345 [Lachnospiraceae bacterium]|nr:hypothetical protein [Lachnospiraceae bacterium]
MRYEFEESFYGIEDVQLLSYGIDKKQMFRMMIYDEVRDVWYCESEKDIIRYKYVVNGNIRLNDFRALEYIQDENGEIWSVPNNSNEICNDVKIEDYYILDGKCRKDFIYDKYVDIRVGVKLLKVSNLHALTYILFQPDGRIHYLEECVIGELDIYSSCMEIVFGNRVSGMSINTVEGMWQVRIYLDGRCVIKDYLVIKRHLNRKMIMFDYKV